MNVIWFGLVYHLVMILSHYEEERLINRPVIKAHHCTEGYYESRLFVFVFPELRNVHWPILSNLGGAKATVKMNPETDGFLAMGTGLRRSPPFPNSAENLFSKFKSKLYWAETEPPLGQDWIKGKELTRQRKTTFEIGHVLTLLLTSAQFRSKLKEPSFIYVKLESLSGAMNNTDEVQAAVFRIRALINYLNDYFHDKSTHVVVWAEKSGPITFISEAMDSKHHGNIASEDICPLLAALMKFPVPSSSRGSFQISFFNGNELATRGIFCTAVQTCALAIAAKQDLGPFHTKHNRTLTWAVETIKSLDESMSKPNFKIVVNQSLVLIRSALEVYQEVKLQENELMFGVVSAATILWIFLLMLCYASEETISWSAVLCSSCILAALFTSNAVVFFFLGLSPTFVVYASLFIALISLITIRLTLGFSKWKFSVLDVLRWVIFAVVLGLAAEQSLSVNKFWASVGVFILAVYSSYPRFQKAPLVVFLVWWCLCLLLMVSVQVSGGGVGDTKFIDMSSTIWLSVSGFAAFWVTPSRDSVICVLFTMTTAASTFLQDYNLIARDDDPLFQWLSIVFLICPIVITVLGSRQQTNRIIHVILACGSILVLTSGRLEPLHFLVVVGTAILWSLMDEYSANIISSDTDTVRRGVMLNVILVLATFVTRTQPSSFNYLKHWPQLMPLIGMYRQVVVSTTMMTIHRSIVPCTSQVNNSYILVMVITALGTLRAQIVPANLIDLQKHGISFALSYFLSYLIAIKRNQFKSEPFPGEIP